MTPGRDKPGKCGTTLCFTQSRQGALRDGIIPRGLQAWRKVECTKGLLNDVST